MNELSVVTAVAGDYVAIEDVGDGTSKKALISDITALAGDISQISAGTAIGLASGTGPVRTSAPTYLLSPPNRYTRQFMIVFLHQLQPYAISHL